MPHAKGSINTSIHSSINYVHVSTIKAHSTQQNSYVEPDFLVNTFLDLYIYIQGMINKRPDCCNKSFMLIDTAYSSFSPSN
jgi:hypothetical protein